METTGIHFKHIATEGIYNNMSQECNSYLKHFIYGLCNRKIENMIIYIADLMIFTCGIEFMCRPAIQCICNEFELVPWL